MKREKSTGKWIFNGVSPVRRASYQDGYEIKIEDVVRKNTSLIKGLNKKLLRRDNS